MKSANAAKPIPSKYLFCVAQVHREQKNIIPIPAPFKIALSLGLQALYMRDTWPGERNVTFLKKIARNDDFHGKSSFQPKIVTSVKNNPLL